MLFPCVVLADKPVAPEQVPGAETVSAEQAVLLIQSMPGLVIVDSRRREEFVKGHIPGAVSLLDSDMTRESLAAVAPDPTTPILFYCNGPRCLRSSQASSLALSWGYHRIYWFRGGWTEWAGQEFPVSYAEP
ncbi:rhodanese-like domain-containing protein [Magnetospira thiophila]